MVNSLTQTPVNHLGTTSMASGGTGRTILGTSRETCYVRVDMGKENLILRIDGERYDSGIRKFGVIMGNKASVGCNTVTNPGTLMGRDSLAYPLSNLSGYIAPRTIVKVRQQQQSVERRSVSL